MVSSNIQCRTSCGSHSQSLAATPWSQLASRPPLEVVLLSGHCPVQCTTPESAIAARLGSASAEGRAAVNSSPSTHQSVAQHAWPARHSRASEFSVVVPDRFPATAHALRAAQSVNSPPARPSQQPAVPTKLSICARRPDRAAQARPCLREHVLRRSEGPVGSASCGQF